MSEQPIRVLHVIQRLEAGGSQAFLMNLYRNIDTERVQFDFLVEYKNKYFYDDEIVKMGGKVYYTSVREDFNLPKFISELKKIIRNEKYKIIHVHTCSIGYFVLKEAKKCKIPVRIAHIHSKGEKPSLRKAPQIIIRKLYGRNATERFACSDEAGTSTFGEENYRVIKNGIDTNRFIPDSVVREQIRNELGISDNFIVGNVGRFHEQKNHMFLLKIFYEIKKTRSNARLLLVGSGKEKKNIISKIKELDLENDVIILSDRKDMPRLYQAMDVFVLPSLNEGFGIVAIEAQTAGIPTVCSTGVPKDVCITELSELMSLNDSAEQWAKNILKISNNEKAHKSMQREIIGAGYDIKKVSKLMQGYYIDHARI